MMMIKIISHQVEIIIHGHRKSGHVLSVRHSRHGCRHVTSGGRHPADGTHPRELSDGRTVGDHLRVATHRRVHRVGRWVGVAAVGGLVEVPHHSIAGWDDRGTEGFDQLLLLLPIFCSTVLKPNLRLKNKNGFVEQLYR